MNPIVPLKIRTWNKMMTRMMRKKKNSSMKLWGKKKVMMKDENKRMMPLSSLNFFSKYSGRVRTLYFSVACLMGYATISQEKIMPPTQPTTVHISSIPAISAAPGSPKISQADSPEARSENAITIGPRRWPPNAKSFTFQAGRKLSQNMN